MPAASQLTVFESVLVVGVAGCTRSGKGTVTRFLREQLPGAGLLCQDKYFKKGGETPDCIDWRTLRKDFATMLTAAAREAKATRKMQVVIAEGFLLFADAEIAACCGVKLLLQLDKATCYARRKATKKAGLAGEAFDRDFEKNVWPAFERHGACASMDGVTVLDASRTQDEVASDALSAVRAVLGSHRRGCKGAVESAGAVGGTETNEGKQTAMHAASPVDEVLQSLTCGGTGGPREQGDCAVDQPTTLSVIAAATASAPNNTKLDDHRSAVSNGD